MKRINNPIAASLCLFGLAGPAHAQAEVEGFMTIKSGDRQAVRRLDPSIAGGAAVFEPLSVEVKDKAGNPVSGLRLLFSCNTPVGMSCNLTPKGDRSVLVMTDANGLGVLNQMNGKSVKAHSASGILPIVVTAFNTNRTRFELTVQDAVAAPPPLAGAVMAIVAGDGQKAARTNNVGGIPTAVFAPLQVSLKDSAGKAIANAQVNFKCSSAAQSITCKTDSVASSTIVTTDSNGIASLNKLNGSSIHVHYGDGPLNVVAGYGEASATFRHTVGR